MRGRIATLEAVLAELEAAPTSRRARAETLATYVRQRLEAARNGLQNYESACEELGGVEERYRTAGFALADAELELARGASDAAAALKTRDAVEAARSLVRTLRDELASAQAKATLSPYELYREEEEAEEETNDVARHALKHGFDEEMYVGGILGDGLAPQHVRRQGTMTEPDCARWWILFELRALAAAPASRARRDPTELELLGETEPVGAKRDLEKAFRCRWELYEDTQRLLPEQRDRRRRDVTGR